MDTVNPFPSAPMAEKAVLSIIFQYPGDFMRQARGEGITAQHFHHHAHLFEAMRGFHEQHKTLDLSVFVQHLHSAGMLERVGGPSTVTDIYTYQPHTANWSIHLQQLREALALRTALLASQSLQDASDSGEAIQTAEATLNALRDAVRGQSRAVNAKDAAAQFLERLQASYLAGDIPGAPTGIHELDMVSGGLKPGEFWVIGGKPSRGKTVFMLQIAANLVTEQIPVVIFTLEVTRGEIIGRLVSCIGKIDHGAITLPKNAKKHELECIQTTVKTIATAPLWIDDSPNISLEAIRNESIRIKDLNHGKLGLVVVDYIQLIRQGRGKNENREEEVARVSGGFKQLAKELQCPVISATQLNEQGQSRESRAIEQDADTCLYIVEDGVKIVKMRNGVRNDLLPLELDGKHQKFTKRYITK
jgi:replicative DNA helicase